jgi:uncharacterized protein YuzE
MKISDIKGSIQLRSKNPPVVELDSGAHAAYIRFSSAAVAKTKVLTDKTCIVTIDCDRKGDVVGVELLGVDNFNLRALLKQAHISLVSRKSLEEAKYVPSADLVAA